MKKMKPTALIQRIAAKSLPALCLLFCLESKLMAVDPLDDWKWVNPLPQGNRMSAITYGGGLLVAVGEFGAIITSPDLTSSPWAVSHSPTNGDLSAVTYGNGLYVAGGAGGGTSGMILTSTDGTNWFKQSWTNNNTRAIYALAYGAGLFVAVGERSGVWTSPDGTNWTRQLFDAGSSSHLNGIAYQEGLGFVAVGSAGKVLASLDGITWVTNLPPTTVSLNAVTYGTNGLGEGIFMAVGSSGSAFSSPDGSSWLLENSGTTVTLKGVAYSPGVGFSAVGSSSSVSWVTAFDGTNWTAGLPSIPNEDYRAVTYASGMFVAVGHYGGSMSSTTGASDSWISRTSYGWTVYNNAGAWNGSNFVVVGTGGSILTSPDGNTWIARVSGLPTTTPLRSVAYGAGLFVTGGDLGTLLTSEDDGTNWVAQSSGVGTTLNGLAYVNDTFMAVGASGVILTSPDGTNWAPQTSFSAATLRGAAYGAGLYVIAGDSGTILTSPDGTNWAPQPLGNTRAINAITYAMNNFVTAGERNRIMTSPDGTNWTLRTVEGGSSSPTLNGVAYGSGNFVVAGGSATILSSPDGTSWVNRVAINAISQRFIVYGANSFVVAGSGGVMIRALAALPTLVPTYDGSTFTLTWSGGGTLQAAPEASGPYTNVTGAVSGYSISPLTEPQQFFRVQLP